MKYTVKVNKVRKNEGNLKGFATVVLGKSFKITNIAILEIVMEICLYQCQGIEAVRWMSIIISFLRTYATL